MKVHIFDVESSERDTELYPNLNSYVIPFKEYMYNVSKIKLLSARIPTLQHTICETNNTFSVNYNGSYYDVSIANGNYTDGSALAVALNAAFNVPNSLPITAAFNTTDETFTFSVGSGSNFSFQFYDGTRGYTSDSNSTTPHQEMGFSSVNTPYTQSITSGAISLNGPTSLVIRISTGSDIFSKHVYSSTPFYTGRLLLDGGNFLNFNGSDDPVYHDFHKGPLKFMKDIKIELFYMSHGRLIPYDFRNQDHVLKFEITCSTDKLENLSKPLELEEEKKVVEPILPRPDKPVFEFGIEYMYIAFILLIGLFLIYRVRA